MLWDCQLSNCTIWRFTSDSVNPKLIGGAIFCRTAETYLDPFYFAILKHLREKIYNKLPELSKNNSGNANVYNVLLHSAWI